jgi:hypothetical protein
VPNLRGVSVCELLVRVFFDCATRLGSLLGYSFCCSECSIQFSVPVADFCAPGPTKGLVSIRGSYFRFWVSVTRSSGSRSARGEDFSSCADFSFTAELVPVRASRSAAAGSLAREESA